MLYKHTYLGVNNSGIIVTMVREYEKKKEQKKHPKQKNIGTVFFGVNRHVPSSPHGPIGCASAWNVEAQLVTVSQVHPFNYPHERQVVELVQEYGGCV